MQKFIRPGIIPNNRIAGKRRLFFEALNPFFGFFYTVKKSIRKKRTAYQDIELIETDEFGKVLLLDNITQLGERNDHSYHEPMVHPALCCHPKPESVLIIGGGDGGILREVLKYPVVKKVHVAELDGGVIEFAKKNLSSFHQNAFNDSRVQLSITDGRSFVKNHTGTFDVIIMDMTDPFGPSKMLYTNTFFRLVKKALHDENGIFVMHSESPVSRPAAFTCINKTLNSVFSKVSVLYLYIQMYGVLWSISICSPATDITAFSASKIDRILKSNGIRNMQVYNGATHHAMQTPFPYISKILRQAARIITDKRPDFPDDFISREDNP
jgi:spermidine synthase